MVGEDEEGEEEEAAEEEEVAEDEKEKRVVRGKDEKKHLLGSALISEKGRKEKSSLSVILNFEGLIVDLE